MQVREAKDFLVQETAKQASIEGAPLSELEKRMMYFTENEEMSEDPIALNDEFEAKHDTDEYEAKISGLLHRAYGRIKKENPEAARQWKQAIRDISKGDHYLPVLWGGSYLSKSYPKRASTLRFLEVDWHCAGRRHCSGRPGGSRKCDCRPLPHSFAERPDLGAEARARAHGWWLFLLRSLAPDIEETTCGHWRTVLETISYWNQGKSERKMKTNGNSSAAEAERK